MASRELRVTRTTARQGVASNGRGAELRFGPEGVEGAFTPGELLALALAACSMMSSDLAISRRAGGDAPVSGTVTRHRGDDNRYVGADVELEMDLSGLDERARADLRRVVTRAVEQGCTVGRTLHAGMPHTVTVSHQADFPAQA